MPKRLLIIGAGLEQVPAYQIAKEKGLSVVGTDMNPDAPAFEFADDTLIASTRDVDETLAVVQAYASKCPIDGVMTIANDVPYTVAAVAEALGLPHANKDAVRKLTNKIHMKTAFEEAGVATPDFATVRTLGELKKVIKRFSFPLILKPSDGRGSNGVLYVEAETDLSWAFSHSMASCANGILVLEDFIEGPQLSVEGMFVDDCYHCVAFADRNYNNLPETKPFIVEDGGTIPSRFDDCLLENIRTVIDAGARSLGLNWGPVKADIVIGDNGGPQIIELAGRLSGNYLATHHIPFAYGVDLVGAIIDLCLGLKIDDDILRPKFKKYLGVRYFFPAEGIIKTIKGVKVLADDPATYNLAIYAKTGDHQGAINCHAARAGTVMMRGDTYAEATQKAEWAAKTIKFQIEKEN